jgi:hypothetical protein
MSYRIILKNLNEEDYLFLTDEIRKLKDKLIKKHLEEEKSENQVKQ